MNVDLNSVFEGAASQFRGLNPNEPGQWPMLPKLMTWAGVALVMVVLGWFLLLSDAHDELDAERDKEPALKRLPRQAGAGGQPGRAAQAEAAGRGVRDPAREAAARQGRDGCAAVRHQPGRPRPRPAVRAVPPGQVVVKDYYAELPIAIKVSGRYHDIGAFAADIANLSRIVTLHNLNIAAAREGATARSAMEATARTYRYLDPAEVETRGREGQGRGQGQRGGGEEMKAVTMRVVRRACWSACCWCVLAGCGGGAGRADAVDGAAAPRGQAERDAAVAAEEVQSAGLRRAHRRRAVQRAEADRRAQAGGAAAQLAARRRDQPAQGAARGLSAGQHEHGRQRDASSGRPYALLRVDNLLYQVKQGDYLGQNYGKITKISETDVALREIVQDAAGEWIERTSALQLQEKAR